MKLKASFNAPRINMDAYRAALNERLGDAIAHAAFIWIEATVPLIPVWSGASRATFRPLASKIGLAIAISPRAFVTRMSLGESQSSGSVTTDANSGKFTFTYATSLAHLIYNEFNDANASPDPTLFARLLNPGPYRFQEAGQRAFNEFAAGVRLPDPFKALTDRIVRA